MVLVGVFVELLELRMDESACSKALSVSRDDYSEGYVL